MQLVGPGEIAEVLSSTDVLTVFPLGGLPKEAEILSALHVHWERAAALFGLEQEDVLDHHPLALLKHVILMQNECIERNFPYTIITLVALQQSKIFLQKIYLLQSSPAKGRSPSTCLCERSFAFYGHLSLHDINQAHSMLLSQHILHLCMCARIG